MMCKGVYILFALVVILANVKRGQNRGHNQK